MSAFLLESGRGINSPSPAKKPHTQNRKEDLKFRPGIQLVSSMSLPLFRCALPVIEWGYVQSFALRSSFRFSSLFQGPLLSGSCREFRSLGDDLCVDLLVFLLKHPELLEIDRFLFGA